jgi:hypothetical protein
LCTSRTNYKTITRCMWWWGIGCSVQCMIEPWHHYRKKGYRSLKIMHEWQDHGVKADLVDHKIQINEFLGSDRGTGMESLGIHTGYDDSHSSLSTMSPLQPCSPIQWLMQSSFKLKREGSSSIFIVV